MADPAKTDKITGVMSYIANKKSPERDFVMGIQPTSILNLSLATLFTFTFCSQSGLSSHSSPLSIVNRLSTLPIRVEFTNDMFTNPLASTFLGAEVTPSLASKRRWPSKLFTTIITVKHLAMSLFMQMQDVKDMQVNRYFSSVNSLCDLAGCHCSIVSNDKFLFLFRPTYAFKILAFTGALYRAILSLTCGIVLKILTTIQALTNYHTSILSQNFIRCKYLRLVFEKCP